MKLRLSIILLAAALAAAPAAGQTVKSLGYNTTNGNIVAATNVTFTNSVGFATNARAATRTNLGGTTVGNAVFTATNAAAAASAIGLGTTNDPTFSNIQLGIFGSGSGGGFAGRNSGGRFELYGTNLTTAEPAFYGFSGFVNTAFSAGTARTNLELGATNNVTFSNITANGIVTANDSTATPATNAAAAQGIQWPGLGGSQHATIYGGYAGAAQIALAVGTSNSLSDVATFRATGMTVNSNAAVGGTLAVSNTATFSTNVTVNGNISVGSLTTTTPSTWALDATQTAAATNGILALPSNANVIRLTNNNAISSVTNGVLGAFYFVVNQATNAVTISNVGGITIDGAQNLTLSPNESATLVATGATNASVANRGDLNNVTLTGVDNLATQQTASSGASLMTRDLGDARYLPTFGEFMDGTYYYQTMTDWMNTRTTNGGTATFSTAQSRWSFGSGTNTNSAGGIRLGIMDSYNNQQSTGGNATWNTSFTVYFNGAFWGASNGLVRFVVGGKTTSAIGEYPTNRAVGVEFTNLTDANGVQLIRLIAHNGTTSTNGPWLTNFASFSFSSILTYGVRYSTNGSVELYRSLNRGTFTNIPSANISGGPTNNPSGTQWGAVDIAAENTDGLGNSGRIQWWGYRYE
jgi:hypothetical protein